MYELLITFAFIIGWMFGANYKWEKKTCEKCKTRNYGFTRRK